MSARIKLDSTDLRKLADALDTLTELADKGVRTDGLGQLAVEVTKKGVSSTSIAVSWDNLPAGGRYIVDEVIGS